MVQPATSSADVNDSWDKAAEGLKGAVEWIGTIEDSFFELASVVFGQASEWGDNVVLVMESTIEQAIDPPDLDFDTTRVVLSVGKADNWNILNGGKQVKGVKGDGMGNSKYQKFVKRVAKDLAVPIQSRGLTPYDADVWKGLKFHFKQEIETTTIRGEERQIVTPLPIKWLQDTVAPLP